MPTQTEVTTWAEAGIKYRRGDSDPRVTATIYKWRACCTTTHGRTGFLNDPCTLPVTDFPAGAFTAGPNTCGVGRQRQDAAARPPIEVDQNPANDGSFLALTSSATPNIRNVWVDVPARPRRHGEGQNAGADRLCLLAGTRVPLKLSSCSASIRARTTTREGRPRLKELVDAGWFPATRRFDGCQKTSIR